jgi:uncharacterized surface protein with fasciclin (FAS1) repeats
MAETLDVTSMIPNKFEPKRKNRWVLMIEGIDAYIIKTDVLATNGVIHVIDQVLIPR